MAGSDHEGNRRRRFQPFKKLQKLFRRKGKAGEDDDPTEVSGLPDAPPSPQAQRRRSGKGASSPNKYRLSMSHDSIFQAGGEPAAGMDSAASIPSLPSSSSRLAAELRTVLTKKRGDDADDDSGLPRSPATPPGGPLRASKNQTGKSVGSCSDGSMLSIYSSGTGTGTDDDIFGPLSENSSRLSLSRDQDSLELRPAGALSHAAAKHRIAVRPKRNHGASRPRRPGRPGPPSASVPATVEEEVTVPDQSPAAPSVAAKDVGPASQGVSAAGADRGRATLPTVGVAERATPVQRSRSTIADRRLRDLSPRKLWGRDASEPAAEKKSEGFFSRLFGSRRSGRKRKTGGKETEETPRAQPSRDPSQEEREEPKSEPTAPPRAPEPEPVPVRAPVPSDVVRSMQQAEVVSRTDVVDRPEVVAERERKQSAAAIAAAAAAAVASSRDAKEASATPVKTELSQEENTTLISPQKEEKKEEEVVVQQEERSQGSPEVSARPRSLLRTGSRSTSQGSEDLEPVEPVPQTPPVQEPELLESVSPPDQETPAEVAPERDQEDQKEQDQEQKQEQEEEGESPPVLRRRRATPEQSAADRSSQTRRSSGSQKLSWMEELRRTPPCDGSQVSSGHELRKTFVKEETVRTPSSGDEEMQRTPSWAREELRKTPSSSGHELRKTWIKEQPKTPPSAEDTNMTPPWVKEELRKSSPPPAVEDAPRTPSWVTEELQRSPVSAGDSTPAVPVRPSRARPARRPASSADPTLPSPSPAAAAGSPTGRHLQNFPSVQIGAEPRRRSSALVFGGAEPVSPPDSGPRSLDSTVLLTADWSEPEDQRRSAPDADPAVSTADGVRLGMGKKETAASSTGSSDRLSSVSGEQGSVVSAARQSVEDVTSVSSESIGEVKIEVTQGLTAEESDPEEPSSGRPESASGSSIRGSDKSGSRKSLAESLESIPSDSGRCDDIATPEDGSTRSLSVLTPDRPEVTSKSRKVSETETAARPVDATPSTPAQGGSRLSPVEKPPTPEMGDGTPEFMKIHLHRVETPSAMTTQVVVPKPKPRETPSKPAWQVEQRDSKVETKLEEKVEIKAETKVDKVQVRQDHKYEGLACDVPEVVLIEKHSPRQARSISHEDPPGSNVKPVSEAPTSPKSPKAAPEVPARPGLSPAARTPESSRHSSLGRQSTQESEDSEPVVLRRRPPPPAAAAAVDSSPDSELLKVFKRRSLKTVTSDEPTPKLSTPAAPADDPLRVSTEEKENDKPRTEVVTASVSPSEARSTWNQRSISMPTGGPKSPLARETGPMSIGPVVTETPLTRPDRPERPRKPAPPTQPRPSLSAAAAGDGATVTAEAPRVKSAPEVTRSLSVASAAAGPSGDQRRATPAEEDGAPTADWLKLVRERRGQREQREQQTMRKLGQKELIIEPETLAPARAPAPRSSRVLEMANTFQKLQPT